MSYHGVNHLEAGMFRQEKITDQFLRISREHTLFVETISAIRKWLSSADKHAALSGLKSLIPKLQNDMDEHFQLEEQFLFPTALLTMRDIHIVDMVLALQKEHGCFETDIRKIHDAFRSIPKSQTTLTKDLSGMLHEFCDSFEKHADIEMSSLFARMDRNRRCKAIIRGFVVK